MNRDWLGDSYDIVKRFFLIELRALGYIVYVDPMSTTDWNGLEPTFLRLLGAKRVTKAPPSGEGALLLDPDKGVSVHSSPKHVAISRIVHETSQYAIVLAFDQSFSRAQSASAKIQEKLSLLRESRVHGFYYDSHARFLFASRSAKKLQGFRHSLLRAGLPKSRLVARRPHDAA